MQNAAAGVTKDLAHPRLKLQLGHKRAGLSSSIFCGLCLHICEMGVVGPST